MDRDYELAEVQANLRYYRNNLQVWDEVGYNMFIDRDACELGVSYYSMFEKWILDSINDD